MNILQSIIIGLVEGLTEFLPISSTAHMDFARQLMNIAQSDFIKSFEIIIQLGAILAVLIFFWQSIFKNLSLSFKKLSIAFLPTAIIGFGIYKIVKTYFLGNTWLMLSMLFLGGVIIILFEKNKKIVESTTTNSLETITYKQAFVIGCAQSLSMVPGVSRSAATIISGLAMNIPRAAIVEFSFLLAIPTMLAAGGYDLYKEGLNFNSSELTVLLVGFVVSFITAWAVIKWLLSYIRKHNFEVFGWYRLIASLLLGLFFFTR